MSGTRRMDPNEQDRLIDKGWTLIETQGHFLWIDPVDGFACSRELALTLQRQREDASGKIIPSC